MILLVVDREGVIGKGIEGGFFLAVEAVGVGGTDEGAPRASGGRP